MDSRTCPIHRSFVDTVTRNRTIIFFFVILNWFKEANAKGAATRGAAAGGGAGVTAGEGGSGNYTEEEMEVALVVLAFVLLLFFSVCVCQCYQKIIWEMSISWRNGDGKKPMPPAPYTRDASSI